MELWLQLLHGILTNVRFAYLWGNKTVTWKSIWVLLKVGCCCGTKPILDSWFYSVTSKSPLQSENLICLLGHWRENQSKLISVPVRAVNIAFVKDHCHKNSGLDPKWDVHGGSFLLSRRNKVRQNEADFDTAPLVRHPWGSPKAFLPANAWNHPTREFAVSQENRANSCP